MNLFIVMQSPAFMRRAREFAPHWPLRYHTQCITTRLAARLLFGDEEPESLARAAKMIDEGKGLKAGLYYDDNLDELIPDLVDLADVYDVPLADVAQALLAVSRVMWFPGGKAYVQQDAMEALDVKSTRFMAMLREQGRVPPAMETLCNRPPLVWTEYAVEGWKEVVERNRSKPYRLRKELIFVPYDMDKLSAYTTEQWKKTQQKKNTPG